MADLPDCLSPSIMTYPFCVEVQEDDDDDDDDDDGIDDDNDGIDDNVTFTLINPIRIVLE